MRNAIDAILRYNSLEKFVFKMEEKVNSKGFRTVREHALRWRSAFRNTSWETIITRAAAGEQCYSLFAMAIRLFSGHSSKSGWLAPMPGGWAAGSLETWRNYVQRNMSLDSIIFAEQVHLYPRPNDRNTKQFADIEQIVESLKGSRCRSRTTFQRWSTSDGEVERDEFDASDAVSADAEGKRRCAIHNATIAASCTSCSAEALCFAAAPSPGRRSKITMFAPAVDTAIKLTRTTSMLGAHHYTTKALQKCCVSGMNQLERKGRFVKSTVKSVSVPPPNTRRRPRYRRGAAQGRPASSSSDWQTLTSEPRATSNRTISRRPSLAATCSGVSLYDVVL